MDPDMVRQQEEAERAANGLAPAKTAGGLAAPVQEPQAAIPVEAPLAASEPAAVAEIVAEPVAAAAPVLEAPAKKAKHSNRRSLPPMGTGRRPGEAPPTRRRLRGLLRLIVYVLVGGIIGAGLGFAGAHFYLHVPQEQEVLYIIGSAGGLGLILGFLHLLHYDYH